MCPPSPCRVVIKNRAPRVAWYTYVAMGGGIFALRRPRPYSRHCEEIVGGDYRTDHHLCPTDFNGKAWRRITMRRAASLQTPPAPTMPMRTSTETAWRPENDAARRVATVGMARRVLRCMRPRPSFTLRQASMGRRGGGSRRGTPHRYALRRTGRIGFKPRYSKGELWRKACMGSILYWLWGPSPSCG